jgi:hypothetical protein
MNREEIYNVWAPPGAAWSPWVKPVLFAHARPLSYYTQFALPAAPATAWMGRADGTRALVLDLPDALGVSLALVAAQQGYRPVPLYNAVPGPAVGAAAVCDVGPILAALSIVTSDLQNLNLPPEGPPAFLLDAARRHGSGVRPTPGMFDNRSVSLPTDFPSANLLISHGVRRAVLIQLDRLEPQEDLAHTLLRWQQAGIAIEAASLADTTAKPATITVRKPPLYRLLWQRMLATAGLRRSPLGGFGGVLPIPSSSG